MADAIVYVDGFNLYYGSLKGSPFKWLDLEALARRLLPKDNVLLVRYFTAMVTARPGDPQQPARQQIYLRALATLPMVQVHFGQFKETKTRMRLVHPPAGGPNTVEVLKNEEKGSDVNLASHLLFDAFHKRCTAAIVVSNDSDLKEPIDIARTELGVAVGVINPHPAYKRSRDLTATFFKQLRESALRACQLPDVLHDANGQFRKPASW
jgi:uncharacterized LabA/DUF88 family protein